MWSLAEYQRLKAGGRLVALNQLFVEPLASYVGAAQERFTTLSMLFTWLLRHREDTATLADAAPFRDWVRALLRGDRAADSLRPPALSDVARLQQELLAFDFSR